MWRYGGFGYRGETVWGTGEDWWGLDDLFNVALGAWVAWVTWVTWVPRFT